MSFYAFIICFIFASGGRSLGVILMSVPFHFVFGCRFGFVFVISFCYDFVFLVGHLVVVHLFCVLCFRHYPPPLSVHISHPASNVTLGRGACQQFSKALFTPRKPPPPQPRFIYVPYACMRTSL